MFAKTFRDFLVRFGSPILQKSSTFSGQSLTPFARRVSLATAAGIFTSGLANMYFVNGIALSQPAVCEAEQQMSLDHLAKKHGIKFFFVSWVDLFGVLRTKMVPAEAISMIQKDGAGFAPFATYLDYDPSAPDMFAIPDPSTFIQVPFQKDIGFVIGDVYIDGKPVDHAPRWVLKNQIEKAKQLGYEFKTGVEPEFFLLDGNRHAISDVNDTAVKPCYDAQALTRRYSVLKEIVESLNTAGFGVYQTDHEDANGQFEINWHYDDCLKTADRHVFFKWCVKTIAERHGFKATFMPRPFENLTGSGCHMHCSLWKDNKNVFVGNNCDSNDLCGLSKTAGHFLGGVLHKLNVICAITNPTINSYKRLNGSVTASGSTWSPNYVTVGGNNRSHCVRIPDNDRFELRVADGAVNPYLLPATVLALGLDGLKKSTEVKSFTHFINQNMYTIGNDILQAHKTTKLPTNLPDALHKLEADHEIEGIIGGSFVSAFMNLKKAEYKYHKSKISSWEVVNTVDC